jgi:sec-independent protein translocase protein TatA
MTLPGTTELLVILFLFMLLFGGKKLPGLARGLGESIRELRKAANTDEDTPSESGKGAAA